MPPVSTSFGAAPKGSGGAVPQGLDTDPAAASQAERDALYIRHALELFRHGIPVTRPGRGLDTLEIADALKMTGADREARVVRMLAAAREEERRRG